jgi:MEMO1 family protein
MPAAAAHSSPFSGTWYPDDPAELRELLTKLFADSEKRTGLYSLPGGDAFVVPHAGLVYSGTVAAAAYRHLALQSPRRVVLLGFSHRGSPPGIGIPDAVAYRTPLGDVPVDGDAAAHLAACRAFRPVPEARVCDHSVEIQLPLVQHAAPNASVVPLYVSHLDPADRAEAARALADLAAPGTVFVASSDFTHYGKNFGFQPFPNDQRVAGRLEDLDKSVADAAGSLDPELFLTELRASQSTVCGYDPISLLLATVRLLDAREEHFQELLDYQTSGAITGDFSHSVSYAALGYFPYSAFHLSEEEQSLLLASARATLASYQSTGERIPVLPERQTPALARRTSAFVTLHKRGELRGCVGSITAAEPLSDVVPGMTLAAALDDSRFDRVSLTETGIDIEISVLSPFKRIATRDEFHTGVHGALLDAGFHRGLLLPQVATEYDWDAAQFFQALARKSGAPASIYGDPSTRLHVFRAQLIP